MRRTSKPVSHFHSSRQHKSNGFHRQQQCCHDVTHPNVPHAYIHINLFRHSHEKEKPFPTAARGDSQALNNGAFFLRGLQTFLVVVKFLGLKIEGPTTFGTDKLNLSSPFPFFPSRPKENGSNFYCFLFKSPSWFSKFTSFTTFGHKF